MTFVLTLWSWCLNKQFNGFGSEINLFYTSYGPGWNDDRVTKWSNSLLDQLITVNQAEQAIKFRSKSWDQVGNPQFSWQIFQNQDRKETF